MTFTPRNHGRLFARPLAGPASGGEPYDLVLELITAKGNHRWVRAIGYPHLENGSVSRVSGAFQDITELKEIGLALQESEKRYRELFTSMNEGFALHEIVTDDPGRPVDYRFLDVNPAFEKLTGLAHGEIVGRTVLEVLPQTEKYWINRYGQVALTGAPDYFENYSAELGKWFSVAAYSPRPQQFCTIFSDITERKEMDEALKNREELFRTLFETMAQGVVYQDATGKITKTNPAAERILGLTLDQMQGRTSIDPRWKSVHEDGSDFPGETHPAMVALQTGKPVNDVIMGIYNPAGKENKWININAVPPVQARGEPPVPSLCHLRRPDGAISSRKKIKNRQGPPGSGLCRRRNGLVGLGCVRTDDHDWSKHRPDTRIPKR